MFFLGVLIGASVVALSSLCLSKLKILWPKKLYRLETCIAYGGYFAYGTCRCCQRAYQRLFQIMDDGTEKFVGFFDPGCGDEYELFASIDELRAVTNGRNLFEVIKEIESQASSRLPADAKALRARLLALEKETDAVCAKIIELESGRPELTAIDKEAGGRQSTHLPTPQKAKS